MSDPIRDLQEESKRSVFAVSAFFLVTSSETVELMLAKLRGLCKYGVSDKQVHLTSALVTATLEQLGSNDKFEWQLKLSFDVLGEQRTGAFQFRNVPDKGFEVEVILPGFAAANAPGFLDDVKGFQTEFMPPAYYH
jgi:hypothetical protein